MKWVRLNAEASRRSESRKSAENLRSYRSSSLMQYKGWQSRG